MKTRSDWGSRSRSGCIRFIHTGTVLCAFLYVAVSSTAGDRSIHRVEMRVVRSQAILFDPNGNGAIPLSSHGARRITVTRGGPQVVSGYDSVPVDCPESSNCPVGVDSRSSSDALSETVMKGQHRFEQKTFLQRGFSVIFHTLVDVD